MTALRLAWLSLTRRGAGSAISVVCVAVAVLACDLMVSLVATRTVPYDNMRSPYTHVIGTKSSGTDLLQGALGINDPGDDVIPYTLAFHLVRSAGEPLHGFPLLGYAKYGTFPVYGTDAHFFDRPTGFDAPRLSSGRVFAGDPVIPLHNAAKHIQARRERTLVEPPAVAEAVLGREVASKTGLRAGDRLTIRGIWREDGALEDWQHDLAVVGIADHGGGPMDRAILTDLPTGWQHYRWAHERGLTRFTADLQATTYLLLAPRPDQVEVVYNRIHSGSVAQIIDVQEEITALKGLIRGARWAAVAVCCGLLLLVAAVMGILSNLRFESLYPELGLLRALGYRPSTVVRCLVLEVMLLAGAGILLAVFLGAVAMPSLDVFQRIGLTSRATPWPTIWNLAVWLAAAVAALLSLALPVARLRRSDIGELLQGL